MRVKDLQEFLGSFTEGSDAVKNAVIFVEINGKLHEIRRSGRSTQNFSSSI